MNILHLNRFYYSGQTTHVFSLVSEQQAQGHNAFLLMDGYSAYQATDTYKKTLDGLGAVFINPHEQKKLESQLKKQHFDIIHVHCSLTFPLAMELSKELSIPYVVTCHGLGLNQPSYRHFFEEAGQMICISQRVANNLREYSSKISVVPNGVDLDEFKPGKKEEPLKIALVTRIDSGKQNSYNQFCKAVDLLEGVEFYVACNKKPLSQNAKYLGWTTQVAELLADMDIVAGTGRTVIEGLAAGNAAIILGRTYQGILTPEKADKNKHLDLSGLSGSEPCYRNIFFDLAKLMQNRIYLQQLQKFSRELAEKEFDNKLLTQRIVEIYEDVLGKRQK